MSSSNADIFKSETVNGRGPLFEKETLRQSGNKFPHMTFMGYREWKGERDTRGVPDMHRYVTKEPRISKISEQEMDVRFSNADHNFNQETNGQPLGSLTAIIDTNLRYARLRTCKFLLLGMGSIHNSQATTLDPSGTKPILQYQLARYVIKHQLDSLFLHGGDFVDTWKPEIIFDSSGMFIEDANYLKNLFYFDHVSKVSHAPLSHVIREVTSPHVFVITFLPNGPVRQMIADLVFVSATAPQAVICAPQLVNNVSRDAELYAADQTSTRVDSWLKNYEAFPFTTAHSCFGPTSLHVYRDLVPEGYQMAPGWEALGEPPMPPLDFLKLPKGDDEYDDGLLRFPTS